jgi:hypothetical protein
VPQEGAPSQEVRELPADPGAEVALPVLRAHGRRTVPVYTSEAQMRKRAPLEWSSFLRLATPALQEMLGGSDASLFINPGGDLSTMLDPLQLAALPEHLPPAERVGDDAAVRPLAPDDLPAALLEPVREFCRGQPAVRAAYAAELDGRPAVGLLLDGDASAAAVLSAAEPPLTAEGVPPFALTVIDEGDPGTLGAAMLAGGRPVYER